MMKKKILFIKTCFILILFCLLSQPSLAQYDGSFSEIFFRRVYSAQGAALGRSTVSFPDHAFSVHYNSSLLGFREGYSVSYSHSSPFYILKDANINYFGAAGTIFGPISAGVSHLDFSTGEISGDKKITTLALVYKPFKNFAVGSNIRRFHVDLGDRTDSAGNLIDEVTRNQLYFDLTSSLLINYHIPNVDESSITLGLTYENPLQQGIDLPSGVGNRNIDVELPSVITIGAQNSFRWTDVGDSYLTKNITVGLVAEFREILEYEYETRISLGTQVSLNDIIVLRGGYFTHTTEDFGADNKSRIDDFTYGAGTNIPLSSLFQGTADITLSLDFVHMQQPLFTTDNPLDIGKFTTVSGSLVIEL